VLGDLTMQSILRREILEVSATADYYMDGRRMRGQLVCLNITLIREKHKIALSSAISKKIIINVAVNIFTYPPNQSNFF
jgi:hypothetical protein